MTVTVGSAPITLPVFTLNKANGQKQSETGECVSDSVG